ncbi:MAG: metal-dependent hydrolase [Gemmatimonadota bacterium]
MDPITHTLAGATMARAGLDRRTPLATATLMLAANAPDIDIATAFAGQNSALAWRRGWTHGPLAWLLLPFIVTGIMIAWDRWVRRRRTPNADPAPATALLLLATIGVLSHPMLDWLNTYGIRLLMPFSDQWFRGDSVFIIDPFLWTVLAVGLFAARNFRPDVAHVRRIVRTAGGATLAYVALMITLSALGERLAHSVAESRGLRGIQEVLYSPRPGNPLAADLVVKTGDAYHFGALRWLSTPRVTFDEAVVALGDWNSRAVERARAIPAARKYLVWSQFPYVRVEATGTDTTVFFGDARYRAGLAGGLQGMQVDLRSGTP